MTNTSETARGTRPSEPAGRRPPRSRYWLGALVAVAGVIVSVVYALVAQAALSSRADGFLRAGIPGQITLHVDRAQTYYVYAEGAIWTHPSVQVTDPQGQAVSVGSTSAGPSYDHGGNGGSAVGEFSATQRGDYDVAVSTGTTAQGDFAVGGQFPLWLRLSDLATWSLLALGVGSSLVLIVRTATLRRRHRLV